MHGLLHILNHQAARDHRDPFSSSLVDMSSIIAVSAPFLPATGMLFFSAADPDTDNGERN